MAKKKETNSDKPGSYEIDTGSIFLSLSNLFDRKWENYNRQFLINDVQEAIKRTLWHRGIVTVKDDGTNQKYLDGYNKNRYPLQQEQSQNKNNFPFPDYFLKPEKSSKHWSIVSYNEPCSIKKGDNYFDLFFALQFSLTDIVQGNVEESDEFLEFHLLYTFENDAIEYKHFLHRLCIKYKEFLGDKYERLVSLFLKNLKFQKNGRKRTIQPKQPTKISMINWQGQSNSLTYLFRQLKGAVNNKKEPLISNSYDEIAHFLKNNFEIFENVKLSTIVGQLKKTAKPKKTSGKIELYI